MKNTKFKTTLFIAFIIVAFALLSFPSDSLAITCGRCSTSNPGEWVTWEDEDGICNTRDGEPNTYTPDPYCSNKDTCQRCSNSPDHEGEMATWTSWDKTCQRNYSSLETVTYTQDEACSQAGGGGEPSSGLIQDCFVRADVSPEEVDELTGGIVTGGKNSGEILPITDDRIGGSNFLICTYSLVKFSSNLLFFVILSVAMLMFAYSAFLFVSSGGNEQRVRKAKTQIIWALAGILFALVAKVVPTIVRGIMGL